MALLRGKSRSSKCSSTYVMRMVPTTKLLFMSWGQLPLTVTHNSQESVSTADRWKQLCQPSSNLHGIEKWSEDSCNPDRTSAVGAPESTSHRWNEGMVKSKVETPRSYIVKTPQVEYRRKRIHLKEAIVNTTVPASTTSVLPKVQIKSVPQHTKDVQSEPIAPTQEYPNNNKGNCNVLAQCIPNPIRAHTETKEPRGSSRPPKPDRHYIETACIDSIDTNSHSSSLLRKLMWYIKPPKTLQHPDTFIV